MIGKRTIMAEELKGQVGEHIPTVIPLMAKAMGMDVKTLFKTMEKGELDPMVALPKLAQLMSEMSAPAMAKYMKSLPYFQGIVQENQQIWGQNFLAAGGTEGLTRFWEVMAKIQEDALPWASTLGDVFGDIMWSFSNFMLLPGELYRWIDGEKDIRNFWQAYLGDFEKWHGRFEVLSDKIQSVMGGITTLGESVLDKYVDSFESNLGWQLEFSDRASANREAAKILDERGGRYSYEDFKSLSDEIYQKRVAERASSGKTDTQTYFERLGSVAEKQGSGGGPFKEVLDFIMGWGTYSDKSVGEHKTDKVNRENAFRLAVGLPVLPTPSSSVMFQNQEIPSLAHLGGVSPENNITNIIPPNTPNQAQEYITKLDKLLSGLTPLPNNSPENTFLGSDRRVIHDLNIMMTGTVRVEGEVETFVPDIDLRDIFSSYLQEELSPVITQNANIAK